MTRGFFTGLRFWLAVALITAGLAILVDRFMVQVAPRNGQNIDTFLGYRLDLEYVTRPVAEGVDVDLDAAWRPRVLSRVLGSIVTGGAVENGKIDAQEFAARVGLWEVGWFVATAIVACLGAGEYGIISILATFCGMMFSIQPGVDPRIYPWDMPALFFFSAASALWMHDRPMLFLPILPVAVLFKETAIVLAFGYYFIEGDRKQRLMALGTALVLAGGTKIVVDSITSSFVGGVSLTPRLFIHNVREGLLSPLLLLSNAGFTACAFLLMPWKLREGKALGVIAIAFAVGIMVFAVATEYRIWFEMIPLGSFAMIFALSGKISPSRQPIGPPPV